MAISQNKYVNIISAVGGASSIVQRDLMGRVFTSNALVPAGQIIEFSGGKRRSEIKAHFVNKKQPKDEKRLHVCKPDYLFRTCLTCRRKAPRSATQRATDHPKTPCT